MKNPVNFKLYVKLLVFHAILIGLVILASYSSSLASFSFF